MNENTGKEPTKKEKAQAAGKDAAEIAAKGVGTYFGGPLGGMIANKLFQPRTGQNALGNVGKGLSSNPLNRNVAPALNKANPFLNGGASNLGDSANEMGDNSELPPSDSINSQESNSMTSNTDDSKQNNSGFGSNKPGLFGSKNDNEPQKGKINGTISSKTKTKIIVVSIISVVVLFFLIFIAGLIATNVMAPIMVVRDSITSLSRQFTTGIEKFINFAQGGGWMTDEDTFFYILNEKYEKFPYTGGDKLDIPLIAATIHYSKMVDVSQYEEKVGILDNEYDNDDFEQLGAFLSKEQTVSFYNIAKDKLGSPNTLWPGQKRLLGHVVKTEITVDFLDYDSAMAKWGELFDLVEQTIEETGHDIYWDTNLAYFNPFTSIPEFLDNYNKCQDYSKEYGDPSAWKNYDQANFAYEVNGFLNMVSKVFEDSKDLEKNEDGTYTDEQKGYFPAPVIKRTMNYGYDEYKEMKQLMLQMKAILRSDGVSFNTDEEVLSLAENSSNSELKEIYDNYKELESKYLYSYTHYLQNVYVPFTYFYNKEYTQEDIDNIIDEIYDQRDFYNYLVGESTTNLCLGSTQAGDIKSLSDAEFVNFIGPIAQLDYNKTGVLASVTIAQAILESGYGNSVPPNSNNLFGVKCGSRPKSECVLTVTNEEYTPGEITTIEDYFRAYDSVEASIEDHSNLLTTSKRYAGITETTDYVEQINIIKNGGYATDSQYVSKLLSLVEQYDLTKWDVIVNASSSALMCGPLTSGGWTIRSTVPTSVDKPYTYVNGNRGQCVWYVQARSIEIAEELASKGRITNEQMTKIRNSLLNNIPGNAEAWYRNGSKSFNSSTDIRNLKAGSIIVWGGGSNMCTPKCGHVAIIEEVTLTSVTITDGWATGGSSCPTSWSCVNFRTRTFSLDEYFNGAPNNFGSYSGTMFFSGYIYFLEPL